MARGKLGSKFDQKLKLWVSPVTVKIWVLQNALNEICTTYEDYLWPKFQLNQTLLTGVIGKVENGKYPKSETWPPNSIDGWSYYKQCENLWMTLSLMVAI